MNISIVCLTFIISSVLADNCPNGGEIFSRGISNQGKTDVVNAHNKYRQQIARGEVPNQPRGVNLKRMSYDNQLGLEGRVVSNTCKMEHIIAKDPRWSWVGQNLYIEWSSAQTFDQNWNGAVNSWFNEHKDFVYPGKRSSGKMTGHYTQVVWADSKLVGCDFIHFYDVSKPQYPYAKLYTCNYGPGGNYNGQAPYKTGQSGCENLC